MNVHTTTILLHGKEVAHGSTIRDVSGWGGKTPPPVVVRQVHATGAVTLMNGNVIAPWSLEDHWEVVS